MEWCDVALVSIDVDVPTWSVTTQIIVACNGQFPAMMQTSTVFNFDPLRDSLQTGTTAFPAIADADGSYNVLISIQNLSRDLYQRAALLYTLSEDRTAPSAYGFSFTPEWCPTAVQKSGFCDSDDTQVPNFNRTGSFLGWLNTTISANVTNTTQYGAPLFNLLIGAHSAGRLDLGQSRANNIYTNHSATFASLIPEDNILAADFGLTNSLFAGANSTLYDAALPIRDIGPTYIKTSFICNLTKSKAAGPFILATLTSAVAILGGLLTGFYLISTFILKLRKKYEKRCEVHRQTGDMELGHICKCTGSAHGDEDEHKGLSSDRQRSSASVGYSSDPGDSQRVPTLSK
ncbi:hypothetical protein P7C73_g4291, partial [Tremellales sp. Uapishka_1]